MTTQGRFCATHHSVMRERAVSWLRCYLLATAILAPLLTGCGGSPMLSSSSTATKSPPSTTLTGNWLLRGDLPQPGFSSSSSGVAVTFDVQGDLLTGTATINKTCGASSAGVVFGAPALTGTVQSNGMFTVGTAASTSPLALAITGSAPLSPGTSWSGSYTLTGSLGPGQSCALNDSGSFEATPVGDVTGTYAGPAQLVGGRRPLGRQTSTPHP